jgi:hypothetical protein
MPRPATGSVTTSFGFRALHLAPADSLDLFRFNRFLLMDYFLPDVIVPEEFVTEFLQLSGDLLAL